MKFGTIRSPVAPMMLDHIDTDQIIPARFLKTVDRAGLGDQLFADWRGRDDCPVGRPEYADAQILMAGINFGCGSSREHAPWALLGAGFRAVIARSFADIFRANALRNGLLPVVLAPQAYASVAASVVTGEEVEVDLQTQKVWMGSKSFPFDIDPFGRDCLLRGIDPLEYVLEGSEDIDRYEAQHG